MTALTPENARPGLRVKCVDSGGAWPRLSVGGIYTLGGLSPGSEGRRVIIQEIPGGFNSYATNRFVLADPVPARPTLRALAQQGESK